LKVTSFKLKKLVNFNFKIMHFSPKTQLLRVASSVEYPKANMQEAWLVASSPEVEVGGLESNYFRVTRRPT